MTSRKFLIHFIIGFLFMTPLAETVCADSGKIFVPRNRRQGTLVGTIQFDEGNILRILDEQDKRLKRFVLLRNDPEKFSVGMRVRIYYQRFNSTIETILPMTPVEYKKEGQNLGYILKTQ